MKIKLNDYDSATFIKVIREWTGLTQKDFGKAIGRSSRQIQYYESGVYKYSIDVLEKIAKEFDVAIIAEKKKWFNMLK